MRVPPIPSPAHRRRAAAPVRIALLSILAAAMLHGPDEAAGASKRAAPPSVAAEQAPQLTPDAISSRIAALESDKTVPAAIRNTAIAIYQQALDAARAAQEHAGAASAYREVLGTGQSQIDALRATRIPFAEPEADFPPETPSPQIEQLLFAEQARLSALRRQSSELEHETTTNLTRPPVARTELEQARNEQEALAVETLRPSADRDAPAVQQARLALAQARRQQLNARVVRLEQELLSHPLRMQLLAARRDALVARIDLSEARVAALQKALDLARGREAARAESEAEGALRAAAEQHPTLRLISKRNATLATELAAATREMQDLTARRQGLEQRLRAADRDLELSRRKVNLVGSSEVVGEALYEELVAQYIHERRAARALPRIERKLAESSLRLVALGQEAERLANLDQAVAKTMEAPELQALSAAEHSEASANVRTLLVKQRDLVERLSKAETDRLEALGALTSTAAELDRHQVAFRSFLEGQLAWVKTLPPLDAGTIGSLGVGFAWLFAPAVLAEFARSLVDSAARNMVPTLPWLLVAAGLIASRRRLDAKIQRLAETVGKVDRDRFSVTLQAAVITVLRWSPPGLLVALAGWLVVRAPESTAPVQGLAVGLLQASQLLLTLLPLRALCAPNGLAVVHLDWPPAVIARWRRIITFLMFVVVPASMIVVATSLYGPLETRSGLGRIAFMVHTLTTAFVLGMVFGWGRSADLAARKAIGWIAGAHWLWIPLLVIAPVALALLAALGYFYTGLRLWLEFRATFWLLIAALIFRDLGRRWVRLRRARLAAENALSGASGSQQVRGEKDLATLEYESNRLIGAAMDAALLVGLWLIWKDLFALLAGLEVPLWYTERIVDGVPQAVPITPTNIVLAIALLVLTWVAARNFPAALEIAVLKRATRDQALRYAVTTIVQYVVVLSGLFAFFQSLGVDWSKLQWLVAALGVGLGFGLQEIFANFVSGIIVLSERQIRVGDTVTVGDISGKVSNIRARATTITDWDRKEVLVPNKSFITERVINWTLSDPVTRLLLTVGVAYGTDPVLTHRVLLDAVRSVPGVLANPEPTVVMSGFGENSLDFELRMFVSTDNRLSLTHAVHVAVEKALRENGIEIPFPQRDIHVRTMPPPGAATD